MFTVSSHTGFYRLICILVILCMSGYLHADYVKFNVQNSHEAVITGQKNTLYVRVGLEGLNPPAKEDRTPLNVALVIDRSGSMKGSRIESAKQAAKAAVSLLNKNDILSIIAYDNTAEVLVPATKISKKNKILAGIDQIQVRGSTALYDGVKTGGAEIKKFLDKNNVNRVILLSDGMANIGPSSPSQLAALGRTLAGQYISVSTIGLGLGYNEDLMSQLAASSDGNHSFVEHADQLAKTMNLEFNDALSVVAKNVQVTIKCASHVRPVKLYGREADFKGQEVRIQLNQLIAGNEKFLLLELEVDATQELGDNLVSVDVSYYDPFKESKQNFMAKTQVKAVSSKNSFDQHEVKKVMEDVVVMIANEKQKVAVKLRDEGKAEEAYQMMQTNVQFLDRNATRYNSKKLRSQSAKQKESSKSIKKKGKDWKRLRKKMKRNSYKFDSQQAF